MSQTHISHQISDYVLGLLPAFEQQKFEHHAAVCGECRHSLQQERKFITTLHKTLNTATTPNFARLAKLRPSTPVKKAWTYPLPTWQASFAVVACLFLFLIAGNFIQNNQNNSNRPGLFPAPVASEVAATATNEPAMSSTATATTIARIAEDGQEKMPAISTPIPPPTPVALLSN